MQKAKRMKRLGTETAFEVLARVNELKRKGKDIISFAIGEPDFDTPVHIKDAAMNALKEGYTHYSPSAGVLSLRESIARYISKTRDIEVDPEEVVVTPGAKPIIAYGILACVNEGDEVIYPNPGFPIYESFINFVGAKPVPLPLLEEREFSFDPQELEKRITDKTKMIIINSPHNPTGGILSRDDLEMIAEISKKKEIWIMSDEIYSQIIYDTEFNSIASIPGMKERTILIDGFSKTYAMTGWRLGFGVMRKDLAQDVTRIQTNVNSCTNTFIQYAGVNALEGPQDASLAMVKEFKERRDIIWEGLNEIKGIRCVKPKGAFYIYPNVTEVCRNLNLENSRKLQDYLLYEAGVAVLGRTCFGQRCEGEKDEYIRLSYATSKEDILEGLRRIKKVVEK
ncbi:pyridoxal phosphate-dependent aminotransferase [Candidatus Aerophobetes bacterium]|uniref:Aminotransferase n=1 Tax=Aerophobetes bacterium TaxID=2030807 RepID=A0A662DBW7_UNCAE|nr:MAG: pyridoxal phosphate-dependent aminotransferase [Candidatus Aerophobetes bacterium]